MVNRGIVNRVGCPFGYCGAYVFVLDTKPQVMIAAHDMPDWRGANRTGHPCPASLMVWPLSTSHKRVLHDQEKSMKERIESELQAARSAMATPPGQQNLSQAVGGRPGDWKTGTLDWQLGGRQDEDVIPTSQAVRGVVPSGVAGQSVGRGPGMSMSDVAAMINVAITAGNEAVDALNASRESIDRERAAINEAQGEWNSASLQDAQTTLALASSDIDQARASVHNAANKLQQALNNLAS